MICIRYLKYLILCIIIISGEAKAVEPNEILLDPTLEIRARNLSQNIRCLVCQNQSIDDSNATLAKDLRLIVREKLLAGSTDREIMDFLVDRYGDFVLLKPPLKPTTYLLWFGPILVCFIGGIVVITFLLRSRKNINIPPLTRSESDELLKLEVGVRKRSK